MDTDTIDQEYEKLQTEFEDVAKTVTTLAEKLQAAAKAGEANASEWLADLKQIATDIDEEQTQAKVLLLTIHRFIGNTAGDGDKPPLFAPGQAPQPAQPPAQPARGFGGGMMGPMMGGYFGGSFARAMEMGAGMAVGQSLVSAIFR